MIGEKEAAVLRGYQADGERTAEEVTGFLVYIGMKAEERILRTGAEEEDTLYVQYRQSKLLMVVTRMSVDRSYCGLNFKFTGADEIIPENIEMSICYEQW